MGGCRGQSHVMGQFDDDREADGWGVTEDLWRPTAVRKWIFAGAAVSSCSSSRDCEEGFVTL